MTQKEVAAKHGISRQMVAKISTISATDTTDKPDHRTKVTADGKRTIVQRLEAGETQIQVAADYGIEQSTVSGIKKASDKKRKKE